ncbi:hypothetical protein GASC598B02_003790, partial [Gilliamella apicola SCGC AB-598-B02]
MRGPVTTLMGAIYASDWELETGTDLALPQITDFAEPPEEKKHIMQLIASGPGYTENMIHQVLLTAIYAAQKQIIFTTPYLASPGGLTEKLHILVGEVDASTATGIHGLAEENEDIKVHVVSRDKAYKWVEDGVINNAASIIALQCLQLNYLNLKNEWK